MAGGYWLGRAAPESANEAIRAAVLRLSLRTMAIDQVSTWDPLPHQIPPPMPWGGWVLQGGRGSGKTDAGAHAIDAHANGPACLPGSVPHRMAIVSTTHDDAVDTCVRGESGVLRANPRVSFTPGAQLKADLTWPNGSEANLFGTFAPEDVERFRGPQHCFIWCDELAAWRKLDDAWDMIEFGLRLGPDPRWIATTTPKSRKRFRALKDQDDTIVTRARLADNPHLDERRRAKLYERYGGTQLGRQELDAEDIDDVQGALWRRGIIEAMRLPGAPDLTRIVVAVDPAVTASESSDETGIIVVGKDARTQPHIYVLADASGRMAPIDWARRAVDGLVQWKADRIIGEANQGGDMVETTIRVVAPNVAYKAVHASRGKQTRAEPVAALYEQGRVHHVGTFPELEDQQCTWVPGAEKSPDRMDALVWGVTELMGLDDTNPWAHLSSAGGTA